MNKTISWVHKKDKIKKENQDNKLEFIGEPGVDGVKDGKLPNGQPYLWKKRRK